MKYTLAIYTAVVLTSAACGKKNDSDDESANSETEKTLVSGIAVGPLNLAIKAEAATPPAFKASTGLAKADSTAICTAVHGGSGDSRTEGYYACKAAYDAREEFFQSGPAVIRSRIDSVENRLNEYVGRLANYEIPCLDPRHTETRVATVVTGADSSSEQEVPPYALKTFSSATTFSDNHTVDFGKTFYFSCKDSFGDTANFDILLGRKDSTWYLGENMKYGPSTPADDASTIKHLMSLDANDNMEIHLSLGSKSLAESTATNPETLGYTTLKNDIYKKSTGFVQVIVRPTEGIIGASTLMNNGCGQRLVMNDVAVYIEVNSNNYGVCYSDDVWINDSGYTGAAYSSVKTTLKGCLRVDGTLPEPLLTLDLCEESGLLVAKDGGGYEDPFSKYGIYALSSNLASPPTGGHAMRAYHGARLWPELATNINAMQKIYIPETAELVVADYASISMPFNKAADAVDSNETVVSAACNAAEATREKTFTQKLEIKISEWVAMNLSSISELDKQQSTEEEIKAKILEKIQGDLANTGDAAPVVSTRVTRSLGANFRAVGIGTYTLKYGDATVGTATVDQSSLANDKGQSDVTIAFSSIPTIAEDGKFVLEYVGKTRLECNNAVSTNRKVNTQLGLASLRMFSKPESAAE